MSERIAAEIWIGGRVPRRRIKGLCQAIVADGAALEWGDGPFHPDDAHDLLAGVEERDGTPLLRLRDDQARWGRFDTLETFLQRYKLPFSRRSDARYEYDGTLLDFRPGYPRMEAPINVRGEVVVPVAELRPAARQLERAIQAVINKGTRAAVAALEEVRTRLSAVFPPELPPLPPFTVQAD